MKQILKNERFQATLAQLAQALDEPFEQVEKKAAACLKEMYAEIHPMADMVGPSMIQQAISRGYDKTIDVNPSELKQLTRLARRHSVAYVLTHKTYLDTLVLASVLGRHGLPMPYMFGGDNLSFAGLAQVGRQAGIIFIRRSFKDDLIYKATLRHYIASLVDSKADVTWAIEGTRSRTGKLVWPKMGILKYIMEGEAHSKQSVKYVPVSIVYDLIPDVKEMTEQGRGKQKRSENLMEMIKYLRSLGDDFGRISVRFGEPVDLSDIQPSQIPDDFDTPEGYSGVVPRLTFKLVHGINQVTPVTTASLICITLLSKFGLTKRAIESNVADLMTLIESHTADALVDRGRPIGETVQSALMLLMRANVIEAQGDSLNLKYNIVSENYLSASYYANMSVHHLYRRAFIELALLKVADLPANRRALAFWKEVMALRDLFKFEFFYSNKATFSDEIEADLAQLDERLPKALASADLRDILNQQIVLVAPAVLYTYIEAYRVVTHGLQKRNAAEPFEKDAFIKYCLDLGEEMHWQGQIQRIEAVSKPFLLNGIRLAENRRLLGGDSAELLPPFLTQLNDQANRIHALQSMMLEQPHEASPAVPIERDIVPGSKTAAITADIMASESGPHIGAFFDLDRTLINGFSAKEFFQNRLLSGRMTAREVIAQFAGVMVYATGNANFAGLAAVGARGVAGLKEQVFIEVGEEVYEKHLADAIYPESRALVAAHMAKGHTVAIVSAATPYQVNPVARDLGIEHVMCTRMQVHKGKFTGKIMEPACWGEGKAHAARELADKFDLDLSKSYFYTDSAEDMPLMEIVGRPRPLNPDTELTTVAYENEWPIYRFSDEADRSSVTNIVRTGLAIGTFVPAAVIGTLAGARTFSRRDAANAMANIVGEFGTTAAGIKLVVKGEENLWSQRPAVFLFNHQSQADFFITTKLLQKDASGIAKKELLRTPIGPLLWAAGIIFVDRGNREKAIKALEPAVEALKNGTSVAIAPEGTRSYDYTLGQFKKGAFHLAMQARVPVVPIIIKNAHDVMPRGTAVFRPTVVEVKVLPPVSTADWNVENLNEHVAHVRSLYLNELGQADLKSK